MAYNDIFPPLVTAHGCYQGGPFHPMSYTNGSTSSAPVTLDSLKSFMDDLERKFPKSERAVKVRCGYRIKAELERKCEPPGAVNPMERLYGLPIETDPDLGYPAYAIEFADGWETVYCDGMEPVRRPVKKADHWDKPLGFGDIFPLPWMRSTP